MGLFEAQIFPEKELEALVDLQPDDLNISIPSLESYSTIILYI